MITAVTTCMGRRSHLETTLPLMLEEFDHVVVVDWSCPQGSGDWAEQQGAQVVRRRGEKYFHMGKARNLGARATTNRKLCFIDADTVIMGGLAAEIESQLNLSTMLVSPHTHAGLDIPNLCGFLAVDIGQFWGVGGYNEALDGYGLEDFYLRAKLVLEGGLVAKRVSAGAIGAIRHGDEFRGKNFKENIEISSDRNREALMTYLKSHGVDDWFNDPRTREIAYRFA